MRNELLASLTAIHLFIVSVHRDSPGTSMFWMFR